MSESQEKLDPKTIPFYPDHFRTELRVVWILVGIAFVIGAFALFSPVGLEDPADPMLTPNHVKPEWYFLALYQLLKYIPKTIGVLVPILGVILVLIWPFLSKGKDTPKRMRYRLVGSFVFVAGLIVMTLWGWFS
jgi:quinol-cytochrome oxidoreductase complex cytochrome b subunit